MITKKCIHCSKEFKTYPSKIKIGRGKYCSKECSSIYTNTSKNTSFIEGGKKTRFNKGQLPKQFKGYSFTKCRKNGKIYKLIYCPGHPFCTKKKTVREHRLIIEKSIGRYLKRGEIVHHINGNTLDNRIENLELLSEKEHRIIHLKDNVHKRWITQH
jgi:hypothetical protein